MFDMSVSVFELIIRVTVIYCGLFLLLRFIGKKHVGELAPFDLIVLLILSETVSNALTGDDKSLSGGLIAAATLLALAHLVSYISWRSKKAERLLEGKPKILVRHGKRRQEMMAQQQVTISELLEALRSHGCTNIADVRTAVLENDGKISVIMREGAPSGQG
jgi:uncharacterized membrane protein YcaP (DUF421 family)